jgi:Transcriptional repressor TCF25
MHLDFLTVKAEQYEWFLEVEEAWEGIRKERPSLPPLDARPGWKWSRSLILKGLSVKKGGGEVSSAYIVTSPS